MVPLSLVLRVVSALLVLLPVTFSLQSQALNFKFVLWENLEELATPALPAGWTVANLNGDNKQWETIKFGGLPASHQCLRYEANPALPADDWLFTSPILLNAGLPYDLSFLSKVSPGTVQKLKIFIGNSPDPTSMAEIYNNGNITNSNMQMISLVVNVVSSGNYYLGFYCYSDPNQKQFFLDDILMSCPTADLNLKFALTKKLLDPSVTPSYSTTEAMEGYAIIENVSPDFLVLNTSFNVGSISEPGFELSYIIISPNGDTLAYVLRSEPEPFSTSRKFETVNPGMVKGRFEDVQKLFRFTQAGTYTLQAVYRSYYKSPGYNVWLGRLTSSTISFIIL